jgi:hypothetical protein
VRGDSLRDLYAKTLALLGLGVLAGAGALVDYWPVGVNVPDAGPALDLPALARPLPVSDRLSVRVLQAADVQRSSRHVSLTDRELPPQEVFTSLPVTAASESGVGEPVSLAAPVSRTAMVMTPASFESVTALNDRYEPHLMLTASETVELQAPASPSNSVESDGFITGAFKKTGSSIVRTGVKTGTSIYDAVRVVGGAVRKALPN